MSIMGSAHANYLDAKIFGLPYLMRHVARLVGKKTTVVTIPSAGRIQIRPADSDASTLRQVFRDQEYGFDQPAELHARVMGRYDAICRSGKTPVIVDAGANIGAASLWFRAKFPQATVVAIEPDPDNVAVLQANVAGRGQILVLDAAIGAEAGFVNLKKTEASWGTQTQRSDAGVEIVTVDDAVAKVPNGELFIAKVDIEGFESDLFASNLGWLDKVELVYIEPHDWLLPGQQSSRSFQVAMAQHPFELFMRGENLIYARV